MAPTAFGVFTAVVLCLGTDVLGFRIETMTAHLLQLNIGQYIRNTPSVAELLTGQSGPYPLT